MNVVYKVGRPKLEPELPVVVNLWLDAGHCGVYLKAMDRSGREAILAIIRNGKIWRYRNIPDNLVDGIDWEPVPGSPSRMIREEK